MLSKRHIVVVWALLLAGVCIGELLPSDSEPIRLMSAWNVSDLALHFGAYAAVAAAPVLALGYNGSKVYLLITALTGCALEFAQALAPGRTPDLLDAIANIAGIAAGTAAATIIRRTFAATSSID